MKSRVVILFIGFVALWMIVILRSAYLQILPNQKLSQLGQKQFKTVVNLPARRGSILDRKGRDLALTVQVPSVYADPKLITKPKKLARQLGHILHESPQGILEKINDPSRRFVWIKRLISKTEENRLRDLNEPGLAFVPEWKRVYPNDQLMGDILGLVSRDGRGIEGLEHQYEEQLKGSQQKISMRRDARGRPLVTDGLLFTESRDGAELRLTIDSEIQFHLENELLSAVNEFKADGAVGVILDAKTSAVLAMADIVTRTHLEETAPVDHKNRAVTDAFEPGSVMKTFVVAAGIKEKLIQPNTKFFCENGTYKVGDRIIREAESQEKFGNLTVTEILALSSNIGTTKIAMSLGDDRLHKALKEFGFGGKTGIDFPGESKGILQNLPWRPHLLANISFGHGISASPLQIANAYAAIANGGVLKTPYILDSIRDAETGVSNIRQDKNQQQILTPEQAKQMRIMLTTVTTNGGTGVNARVNGFAVAGKTGTAQKVNPTGKGYLEGRYISSFAGFLPANDPRFVIFVAVDSPRTEYYSAKVAAPLFSRIASFCVQQDGIAPTWIADEGIREFTEEKMVQSVNHSPQPTKTKIEFDNSTVPDIRALSAREILREFRLSNLKFHFSGSGKASKIIPEVGSNIPANREIKVILE